MSARIVDIGMPGSYILANNDDGYHRMIYCDEAGQWWVSCLELQNINRNKASGRVPADRTDVVRLSSEQVTTEYEISNNV